MNERISANVDKVLALQRISETHPVVSKALAFHAKHPFEEIQMDCSENEEARDFYLQVLKAIKFTELLRKSVSELIRVGEAIFVFEQNWRPAAFLDPLCIDLTLEPTGFGQSEEHVNYKPDYDVRKMVLNTPSDQRSGLLQKMDEYTLRQIELGRYVNLTRSPYMKVVHLRRQVEDNYQARGTSFFDPILDKLLEQETAIAALKENKSIEPALTKKKIKDIDKLVFDYCFPAPAKIEKEYHSLQTIVKEFLVEEVFKPTAMGKNFTNSTGLLIPKLDFREKIDEGKYLAFAEQVRSSLADGNILY